MRQATAIMEPICNDADGNRFVMFPIRHDDVWSMYKKAESAFWTAEEIDLTKDLNDWETRLTDNERFFVKHVLAFFAASDGIVNENLAMRFYGDVKVPEIRAFYSFQIAMETIHSEMYSLLLETYVRDPADKSRLFAAVRTIPCIRRKADWAMRWIDDKETSFVTRLVAFACVEGIFFSGAFCSIFWLKERGVMPGLCLSNEFISRDEALHTEFAVLLYRDHVVNKLDDRVVHRIVGEAVAIEEEFVTDAIPCAMLGMNASLMRQYVRFVADRLLVQMGHPKLYDVRNPFPFMERIALDGKTNFFEHRESMYAKANVVSSSNNVNKAYEFSADGDF